MKKGDIVYYARIFPELNTYEVSTLSVRTVYDDYFVATDKKTKHALMFSTKDIGYSVFMDEISALEQVRKAKQNPQKKVDVCIGARKVAKQNS